MPSIIIWNVWKERNKRIFKDEKTSPLRLLDLILKQIRETISTTIRNYPKNPPTENEMRTLRQLRMQEIITNGLSGREGKLGKDKVLWQPPPKGYLKCNMDSASKGNPGIDGYAGVLRDEYGIISFIFHFHLGKSTNNMAELMALEQCLELLNLNHSSNVIIEADSKISIKAVKRISCGVAT